MAPFTILFDLDGTLADSQIGVLEGFRRATRAVGLSPNEDVIREWIGPPLEKSLREFGVAAGDLGPAMAAYRDYYATTGRFEVTLFQGVGAMLEELGSMGAVLAVTTAKMTGSAEAVLSYLGISDYFSVICGAGPNAMLEKSYIVADALSALGRPSPTRTALVGDRRYDIEAATAHGLRAIGATWGYGSADELHQAGAAVLVDRPADVVPTLLNYDRAHRP